MVQSLKRMQYFTDSQRRKFKRGLNLRFTDYKCQTILYPLQSFNIPIVKIVQKGIAIVKMTSNWSPCNRFCSFWAKVLPNTQKVTDVMEAYFASLRDLSLEVKITIKNESQISNECFRKCVIVM